MLALIIMVRQRGPTISEASIQTNKRKGGHITHCVQTNICTGLKRKKPVTTHQSLEKGSKISGERERKRKMNARTPFTKISHEGFFFKMEGKHAIISCINYGDAQHNWTYLNLSHYLGVRKPNLTSIYLFNQPNIYRRLIKHELIFTYIVIPVEKIKLYIATFILTEQFLLHSTYESYAILFCLYYPYAQGCNQELVRVQAKIQCK